MILFDFRYQDPWAEENFTLPDVVQQSQAQQHQNLQAEINRKTLDTLLTKLSQKDQWVIKICFG
jgi:DNA-directed RNA polymerase sigma subunit (sigma70/sigma32)